MGLEGRRVGSLGGDGGTGEWDAVGGRGSAHHHDHVAYRSNKGSRVHALIA